MMKRAPWVFGLMALVGLAAAGGAEMSAFLWTPGAGISELGTSTCARSINNRRQICGELWTGTEGTIRAFVWSPGIGIIELATLDGFEGSNCFDLGEDGTAVGASFADDPTSGFAVTAVLWGREGLVNIGSAGSNSAALGINARQQVVGWSETASGARQAFVWTRGDGMTLLGTLGGANSVAADVNNRGQVVGYAETAAGAVHAFLWAARSGMMDLGTLGGVDSRAFKISESGLVTGSSGTASGATRAFSWSDREGLVDLGTADESSAGFAINNRGQVVGGSLDGGGFSAQLWDRTTGNALEVPPDVIESLAWSINDRGEVVGYLER